MALGAADRRAVEGEALLDVPDDVRLEPVAVRLQQVAFVGGEQGGAQHLEGIEGARKVRACLLDREACAAQCRRRAGADGGDLAVHRQQAQVRAVGDPRGRRRCGQRLAEAHGRRFQGERVLRVRAGHGVEQERGVAGVAGHRAFHHQVFEGQAPGAARDAPRAWAEAENPAEACWDAQAAAEIRTRRQPDLARGQRGRRAARRAAAGLFHVPGIAGLAEDLVEGAGAGAELRRVGLADHDGTVGFERLHQHVRPRRHVIGVDRRTPGGADAFDGDQILDGDGQPAEPARRAFAPGVLRLDPPGAFEGAFDTKSGQRVEPPVGRRDALGARLDQFDRRDLAALQQADGFGRRQPPERIRRGHGARACVRPPVACGRASRCPAGRRGRLAGAVPPRASARRSGSRAAHPPRRTRPAGTSPACPPCRAAR